MANARGVKRERSDEGYADGMQRGDGASSVSPSQKRGKFERSFVPSWLDRFDWLVYDNERNMMFCDLCRRYRKNNAFTEGCQNFRRDNLNKHMSTNDHKNCVDQDGLNKSGSDTRFRDRETAQSPLSLTPGRHSSSSSRSSGVFSLPSSSSLPQSPASMPLPSPPSFAPARSPLSSAQTLHAPVPLLPLTPLPPMFQHYAIERRLHYGDPNGESKPKEGLPITPNYLTHPPFPYLPGSSSYRPSDISHSIHAGQSAPGPQPMPPSANTPSQTNGPCSDENELVLKVRVANSMEQDFIEIEIEKARLGYDYVISTICRELNVNPSIVHKLRKLPNTIVRKDKDVRRFTDFQELELVLTNRASSETSRSYGSSVSPRHVDVVY